MIDLSKYAIGKRVALDDGSEIVLLDMLSAPATVPQDVVENNLYRIARDGKVIWRVSAQPPVYARSPFTGVGFDDMKQLIAYRWDGDQYRIDLSTGAAEPLRLGR